MVKRHTESRFVAGGRERIIRDEIKRLRQQVCARHAGELAQTGFLGRLLIRQPMRRALAKELERIAPQDALLACR